VLSGLESSGGTVSSTISVVVTPSVVVVFSPACELQAYTNASGGANGNGHVGSVTSLGTVVAGATVRTTVGVTASDPVGTVVREDDAFVVGTGLPYSSND
jgi:ascorbate-specific PTS system EIIC-type component UlaA